MEEEFHNVTGKIKFLRAVSHRRSPRHIPKSSGMWTPVAWFIVTNVYDGISVFIFRIMYSWTAWRNVGTTSRPTRLETSSNTAVITPNLASLECIPKSEGRKYLLGQHPKLIRKEDKEWERREWEAEVLLSVSVKAGLAGCIVMERDPAWKWCRHTGSLCADSLQTEV